MEKVIKVGVICIITRKIGKILTSFLKNANSNMVIFQKGVLERF